ncbi:hypothetical protein IEQ34_003324 [Dendrobium chrysotoxum]|uniref:Secreted protein n=1 Tax=Dendrobium chrysotoxum TaxID=161865 RepID=A0AAV7HIE0_DENCH|nr:hypothetical protein IEQ34_003324 [Dendrobium chrysotoxum]
MRTPWYAGCLSFSRVLLLPPAVAAIAGGEGEEEEGEEEEGEDMLLRCSDELSCSAITIH